MYSSPLKASSTYGSPVRGRSAAHNTRASLMQTPIRNSSPLRESRMSPVKESSSFMRASSPMRKQPPLRLEEEDELVKALREQISLERELENAKIALI